YLEPLGTPLHSFSIGSFETITLSVHLWSEQHETPDTLMKTSLRQILTQQTPHLLEALIRAKELVHWFRDNRFCGRCGKPMEISYAQSAFSCKACNFLSFPRLSPACIVLIIRGDEVLLARSPHFIKGVYSLIAGFVEAGESAEACAKREVKEEVGVEIEDLRYFGTQSWPFPHSLMIGFFATYKSGEICIQEDEIEDAQWFTKETLPIRPYSTSIASQMLEAWLDKR
ncbi:MAG: NAD(+) diphosphatase, partial [Sulfurospirillaceae bacterium]|nr:NAD(+) diphosphatase [Sulfurospirillaceae bacterium]